MTFSLSRPLYMAIRVQFFYLQLKGIDSACSQQTNVICCFEDFNDSLVMRKSVLVRFLLLNTFIAFNSNITFFSFNKTMNKKVSLKSIVTFIVKLDC